jgi:hypothetical protein
MVGHEFLEAPKRPIEASTAPETVKRQKWRTLDGPPVAHSFENLFWPFRNVCFSPPLEARSGLGMWVPFVFLSNNGGLSVSTWFGETR